MLQPGKCSIPLLLLCGLLLAFACNTPKDNIPLGSRKDSGKKFSFDKPYFERGNLDVGLRKIDSVFRHQQHPTLNDYIFYYGIHCWISRVQKKHNLTIAYTDTIIGKIGHYPLDKDLASSLLIFHTERALAYLGQNKYDKAIDVLFNAKKIARQYSDSCSGMNFFYYLALTLYQQEQYQLAAEYFTETMSYAIACNSGFLPYSYYKQQELWGNIGLCNTKLKKYPDALACFQKALSILDAHPDSLAQEAVSSKARYGSAKAVTYGNMAKVYVALNHLDTAIDLYNKAVVLHDTSKIEFIDNQLCRLQLAELYLRTQQPAKAYVLLRKVGALIHVVQKPDIRETYLKHMYTYFQRTGNATQALQHYERYITLRDSIANSEKNFMAVDIEKELRDKQRVFEIQLLQKDNQLNRLYLWLFVGIAIAAIAVVIVIYYWFNKSRKNVAQLTLLNTAITQQKKEIEAVMEDLELSNRAKEKLMHVMAHELRSPISGITALSGSILQDDTLTDEQHELIGMIENTSASTLELINEILDSRERAAAPLQLQWANINEVVRSTLVLLQFKASEKQQQIMVHYADDPPDIPIDIDKIERTLINLITNAIKFSSQGSVIDVTVQHNHEEILIAIKDKGIGIPVSLQEKLFDAESDTKRAGTAGEKSYGLGLNICKQIIEQHKGKLWVQSDGSSGSTFFISLPLIQ